MSERDQDQSIGGAASSAGGSSHGSVGEGGADVPSGIGQGEDLAEALGGREEDGEDGEDGEHGEATAPARGAAGADPGGPGGMGGVHGGMSNPDHRPNGGVSPIQGSDEGGSN